MGWIWIRTQLIVNIIIFHGVNQVLNQYSIHIKPTEVIHGILGRNFLTLCTIFCFVKNCSSILAHLGNLYGGFCSESTLVPYIANHNSLPSNRRNKPIKEEQHDSIVVEGFDQESLSFLFLHDLLHVVVKVVVLSHPVDKLIDFLVVLVNALKQSVESFNDVQVRLLELLVDFNQINVCLDSLVALVLEVLIKQVSHVEKDLFVLSLFVVLQTQGVLTELGLKQSLSLFGR